VATGDPLLTELSFLARVQAIGAEVLVPDDTGWRDRIAGAGVGVTAAIGALAATGTVAVACGPGSPRSISLVPPAHLCLLPEDLLVTDLAEALASILTLPSALTWISGPSRSADLEMTLTLGVHGPATVDVVIVAADGERGGGCSSKVIQSAAPSKRPGIVPVTSRPESRPVMLIHGAGPGVNAHHRGLRPQFVRLPGHLRAEVSRSDERGWGGVQAGDNGCHRQEDVDAVREEPDGLGTWPVGGNELAVLDPGTVAKSHAHAAALE
jgi:hypothetical protein